MLGEERWALFDKGARDLRRNYLLKGKAYSFQKGYLRIMSNAMSITGNLSNLEIDGEGRVSNLEGEISEVALQNGEKITIIGEIRRIMREARTSTASAFKLETPGKPSEFISSADSPKLYNDDGSERELPRGATLKQEFQAKAGQELTPQEEVAETGTEVEVSPTEVESEIEAEAEAQQD